MDSFLITANYIYIYIHIYIHKYVYLEFAQRDANEDGELLDEHIYRYTKMHV